MENKNLLNQIEVLLNQEELEFEIEDSFSKKQYYAKIDYLNILITVGLDKVIFYILTTRGIIKSGNWQENDANESSLEQAFKNFVGQVRLCTNDANKRLDN